MRCAGGPTPDSTTMFDEADLTNVIELNPVEKRSGTGSFEWEWYTV